MSQKDEIPVVFIHTGHVPLYLANAIEQAQKYGNRVVLITDHLSASVNAEIVDYASLNLDEKEFKLYYKHMSSNSYDFEFICIYRWFLLKNYMAMEKIDRVLYLDSDVYLYENANKIVEHYSYPEFGYNVPSSQENYRWAGTASCSVWHADALNSLCTCIKVHYTTEKIRKLEEKWDYHTVNCIPGGICDMTFLYIFSANRGFFNLGKVHHYCCFDYNHPVPDNYEKNEYKMSLSSKIGIETKMIHFVDGLPYCKNLLSGEKVRFFALTEYAKLILAGQRLTLATRLKRRSGWIFKRMMGTKAKA